MNWYIISGILLAAASTGLLTYGSIFYSRAESAKSEQQLDQISRDLADLRGKPKSDLSKDALVKVEKDVGKWAREFATDKQRKRLAAEQKWSEHQNSVDHSNALSREYFTYFLTVIRDALTSYVQSSGADIKIDLPDTPSDLFSDQNPYYSGNVVFNSTTSWKVRTSTDNTSPTMAPAWIGINLLRKLPNGEIKEKGQLDIRFTSDGKSFWLRLQQDFRLAVPLESVTKPAAEFEETIRSTIIGLIEFQLLHE
jgi:hypothetical protein